MNRERERHRGIQMRSRYTSRHVAPHRHRQAPDDVDGELAAGGVVAQDVLGDDAHTEGNQDERAEKLGQQFAPIVVHLL